MLTLTPIFTEDFTQQAVQNPLWSENWTEDQTPGGFPPLQVVTNVPPPGQAQNVCEPTVTGAAAGEWLNTSMPADGFLSITFAHLDSDLAFSNGWYGVVGVPQDTYPQFSGTGFSYIIAGSGLIGELGFSVSILFNDPANSNFPTVCSTTQPVNDGDTVTIAWVGINHFILINGVVAAQGSYSVLSGSGPGTLMMALATNGTNESDAQVSEFVAGSAATSPLPSGWSPQDCRNYATFPNTGETQTDGSVSYSALIPSCGVTGNSQASDNAAIPPTDSRTAGKVVDSRTSTPVNSRVSPNGFS